MNLEELDIALNKRGYNLEQGNLPNKSGVYLFTIGDSIIYIGASTNLRIRYVKHQGTPWFQLLKDYVHLNVYWIKTIKFHDLEEFLLRLCKPKLNKINTSHIHWTLKYKTKVKHKPKIRHRDKKGRFIWTNV